MFVGAVTVAVEFAPMLIVVFDPPLILKVAVTGTVIGFVNVMTGAAAFKQTEAAPLIVAVGAGNTVTVADPEIGLVQGA